MPLVLRGHIVKGGGRGVCDGLINAGCQSPEPSLNCISENISCANPGGNIGGLGHQCLWLEQTHALLFFSCCINIDETHWAPARKEVTGKPHAAHSLSRRFHPKWQIFDKAGRVCLCGKGLAQGPTVKPLCQSWALNPGPSAHKPRTTTAVEVTAYSICRDNCYWDSTLSQLPGRTLVEIHSYCTGEPLLDTLDPPI